ncbi:MAG TPA: hypothetical protein PK530_03220, partial [Anaerolineales bacterium]|nr:hypothetical protein [Anaerolineales bacterium]
DVHLLGDDDACLSLLRHLGESPTASLLLISRKEMPLPMPQLQIGGLAAEEAQALANGLGLDYSAPAIHHLLDKTGGNPMLLRLAAGQLLDNPTSPEIFVQHLEAQTQVTAYLLKTVLHDLSPATRWLAFLIAVFRHPIDLYEPNLLELIEKFAPSHPFQEALTGLQSRYLVENLRAASLHPLIRDHLYAALLTEISLKKSLHALAAEWSDRVTGNVVEIAHHWLRAGELAQTAEIISTHSEALFNQGRAHAAVQVVDEALEVLRTRRGETTRLRWLLLTARGDLLRGTLRNPEAEANYREALTLAENTPQVRAQIVRNLAQILLQRGRAAEALYLIQTTSDALPLDNAILRARLAAIECRVHLLLSHYDQAEKTANLALQLAEPFAIVLPQLVDDIYARAERTLGWINYTRHPQGPESLAHYRRALASARRSNLRVLESAILSNTATALMEREEWDQADQVYHEALQVCDSLGDVYGRAGILHNLGVLFTQRKTLEVGLKYFEEASILEKQIGDVEGLLSTEAARASGLLSLGKQNEARVILDEVLANEPESSDAWTLGTFLCLSAEVYLLQGAVEAARAAAQRVLALPGINENARMQTWALCDLALVHTLAGETEAAQAIIHQAPPEDVGFSVTYHWKLAQVVVALALGESAHAQAIITAAEAEAKEKGYRRDSRLGDKLRETPTLSAKEALSLMFLGE